jgi:hypothetical protein
LPLAQGDAVVYILDVFFLMALRALHGVLSEKLLNFCALFGIAEGVNGRQEERLSPQPSNRLFAEFVVVLPHEIPRYFTGLGVLHQAAHDPQVLASDLRR